MIDCLLTFGFFTCQGRGIINGKAGKAAALPKFSDMLTLSQPERGGSRLSPNIVITSLNRNNTQIIFIYQLTLFAKNQFEMKTIVT